ncbi:MAG: hypothetical protein ABL927_14010 [Bdellovibrionales bacterium]
MRVTFRTGRIRLAAMDEKEKRLLKRIRKFDFPNTQIGTPVRVKIISFSISIGIDGLGYIELDPDIMESLRKEMETNQKRGANRKKNTK